MRIVFLYPLEKRTFTFLKENLPNDIEIITNFREDSSGAPPNLDKRIIEACKKADIIMGPYVTEEILSLASPKNGGNLKLIFIPWAGVDRVDFDLIQKYNIPLANSHGNARTVAEHAITLLLAASKKIILHDKLLRAGDWSACYGNQYSLLITNKTVGILGFGAIGTECAKLLQGFNVNIIACRNNPKKSTREQKDFVKKIYSTAELNKFLSEADFIINTLPLTEFTHGIIGREQFNQMKKGVIIINIGRGATIDEEAFYNALREGKIFAAGIDPVWNYPPRGKQIDGKEPIYPSKYPIHEFENVILSPHRASDVEDYEKLHWKDVVDNILMVYHGKNPLNIVNIDDKY